MSDGLFRRRRLPHWDVEDATYFVTACLANSIPAKGLIRLQSFRETLESRQCPEGLSVEEWAIRKHKLIFARFDEIIDAESAVQQLADPGAASVVQRSLRHFAGERYDLLAFVIMPSHFHWVFHPRQNWVDAQLQGRPRTGREAAVWSPRQDIMKSVKGYSAYRCNQALGLSGEFWQDESYDHVVRDDAELLRIIDYVELNPVRACLVERREDWQWSSACLRTRMGIPFGEPLPGNAQG